MNSIQQLFNVRMDCIPEGHESGLTYGANSADIGAIHISAVEQPFDFLKGSRKCLHEGCTKKPSFNLEGEKPLYCKTHKSEAMIDVLNKKCLHKGCTKQPSYNLEGEEPLYCKAHKLEGMIDVLSKKCIHEGCTKRPNYNLEGEKSLYCLAHKKEGMINVTRNKKRNLFESTNTRDNESLEEQDLNNETFKITSKKIKVNDGSTMTIFRI